MADSYWQSVHWFLFYLNDIRGRFGFPRLNMSYQLCEDCQSHNRWMASGGGLNHSSYPGYSENIALLEWKPEIGRAVGEFLRMWLSCQGHRDILLQNDFWCGIAFYYSDNGIFATFRICR